MKPVNRWDFCFSAVMGLLMLPVVGCGDDHKSSSAPPPDPPSPDAGTLAGASVANLPGQDGGALVGCNACNKAKACCDALGAGSLCVMSGAACSALDPSQQPNYVSGCQGMLQTVLTAAANVGVILPPVCR